LDRDRDQGTKIWHDPSEDGSFIRIPIGIRAGGDDQNLAIIPGKTVASMTRDAE
jgi:hypothetical protein